MIQAGILTTLILIWAGITYANHVHDKRLVIYGRVAREPYLVRWHLISTRWFRVFLHSILRPDEDRDLHNHPWAWGFSLVLSGSYDELGATTGHQWWYQTVRRFSWRAFKLSSFHRITNVRPGTWTLFFAGPRVREWGFRTEGGTVVDWREYLGLPADHTLED